VEDAEIGFISFDVSGNVTLDSVPEVMFCGCQKVSKFPDPVERTVFAAGFYVVGLGVAGNYLISASLNGTPTATFRVPHSAPGNGESHQKSVFFIGVVHLAGFYFLEFDKGLMRRQ
jgi:hypothetical protein